MYYETIEHKSVTVNNAKEAIELIESGRVDSCQCPVWKHTDGKRYALVSDVHCDSKSFSETALINLDNMVQIGSITLACIETTEEKISVVLACISKPFMNCKSNLQIDDTKQRRLVLFECDRCRGYFKSTIAKQKRFNKDNGFGICPNCELLY